MKPLSRFIIVSALAIAAFTPESYAQQQSTSTLRKRDGREVNVKKSDSANGKLSGRMLTRFEEGEPHDADLQWMKVVYRRLDAHRPGNAALYYPEEYIPGEENLFRIILRLVSDGSVPAYEYTDRREMLDDNHRISVAEMLERFHIPATEIAGKRFAIENEDVPADEIKSYYIVERWEFNARDSRTRTSVDAICPVMYRNGDYDGEEFRFPMFWVKMSDLRPYLACQEIFVDDNNNLKRHTYDNFFAMNMYDGEIYKTRNLADKSMAQLYPDSTSMKNAQDSIDSGLRNFDKKLWVPSREEVIAARERREAMERGDSISVAGPVKKNHSSSVRAKRKTSKVKSASGSSKPSNSSALRSVRRRK